MAIVDESRPTVITTALTPPRDVTFTRRPIYDAPRPLIVLMAITLVAGGAVGALGGVAPGLVAAALTLVAGWRAYVPVTWHVSSRGVVQSVAGRGWRIRWASIGRYEITDDGLWIFPIDPAAPVDYLRGRFIPWPAERDELLRLFAHYALNATVVDRGGRQTAAARRRQSPRSSDDSTTQFDLPSDEPPTD